MTTCTPALRISEEDFLRLVLETAAAYGWLRFHPRPARTVRGWVTALQGDPGWPDVVLCRPPEVLVAELKTTTGKVRDTQGIWLEALASSGLRVFVWRPDDWEEILAVLRPKQAGRHHGQP